MRYPSRQPIAVKTSPRRSFLAVQSAWYQRSLASSVSAAASGGPSGGGSSIPASASERPSSSWSTRWPRPSTPAMPGTSRQLGEVGRRERDEVHVLPVVVEDPALDPAADGGGLEEGQHRCAELRDPVRVLDQALRLVGEEDDVEIGPAVGRRIPPRVGADDDHAADVLARARPVRDLRRVEVARRVHVQEHALGELDDIRVDAAQRQLPARDARLELGQQRSRVRARERPRLRHRLGLGENAERVGSDERAVDRKREADVVRRRPQARDDAEDRRALLRSVVEHRERQLERGLCLPDSEYFVTDLVQGPPRPLGERLAPELRERLRRAEALRCAADEEDPRRRSDDPPRLGVDRHPPLAHEAAEREAAILRELDRERRRRSDRHDDRAAGDRRLLHELEREPAAHAEDVLRQRQDSGSRTPSRRPCPSRCAGRRPRVRRRAHRPARTAPWRGAHLSPRTPAATRGAGRAATRSRPRAPRARSRPAARRPARTRSHPCRRPRTRTRCRSGGAAARGRSRARPRPRSCSRRGRPEAAPRPGRDPP